ncbi:MAG TPA: hypothetical protein VEI47_01945, partial [Gemmatimonadales bacterium]|nr:hypothetical protein [Gemmatimonadales bacterium]
RPESDAEEFRRFANLLLAPPASETPVVPIDALFFAGEEGIVSWGASPRGPVAAGLGAAAVVSRGEHLCQAADEIASALSPAQRDVRLHLLGGDLRTLAAGLPPALEIAVEAFAVSARSAIGRGAATSSPGEFTTLLREAGKRLLGFTEVTQPSTLATAFEALIATMDLLSAAPAQPAPPRPVPSPSYADVVPIESLAPDDVVPIEQLAPDDIVPIESLEYDEVVSIESLAPDEPATVAVTAAVSAVAAGWDLASSYALYEELQSNGGRGAAAAVVVAPAPVAAPERLAPAEPAPAELPVVEIDELLYHGRAALLRAGQVQRAIRSAVSAAKPMSTIQPLVEELLDLVELAVSD